MNLFVSAGEVSGDRILAAVLAALRTRVPDLKVRGLGGEASARQGLRPLLPLGRTAVSGIGDVLARAAFLARMRGAAFACLESREAGRPDLALLVDYPGLNLRLAARARALGIPVWFIAPPQAWLYRDAERKAVRARRFLAGCAVHALFPFEKEAFADGAERVVHGHFLETAPRAGAAGAPAGNGEGELLLLCPGSREGALARNLPAWLRALDGAGLLPGGPAADGPGDAAVLVPPHLAPAAERMVAAHTRRAPAGRPPRVTSDEEGILRITGRALAFPGTVTLELALRGIPAAVLAAADPLTLFAGRRLLRGPWLGLPNQLLGREAFPEWAGRPGALAPAVLAGVWERLRAADGAAEGRRLRELLGPPTGVDVATAGCLELLGKA